MATEIVKEAREELLSVARRMAEGEDLDPRQVAEVLNAAGIPGPNLEEAVAVMRRRVLPNEAKLPKNLGATLEDRRGKVAAIKSQWIPRAQELEAKIKEAEAQRRKETEEYQRKATEELRAIGAIEKAQREAQAGQRRVEQLLSSTSPVAPTPDTTPMLHSRGPLPHTGTPYRGPQTPAPQGPGRAIRQAPGAPPHTPRPIGSSGGEHSDGDGAARGKAHFETVKP